MQNNDLAIVRDFQHRYQQLSQTSGYQLAYDTMALLREITPCAVVSIFIFSPKVVNPENVELGTVPMWITVPAMANFSNYFFSFFDGNTFAKRFASQILSDAMASEPIKAYALREFVEQSNGFIHRYYKKVNRSDLIITASLLAGHQFVESPYTESYYGIVCNLAHNNGQAFSESDKRILPLCFDIFVQDFKNKIRSPEHSAFLPFVTGEKICKRTKIAALFDTGDKFKPRELATIKACFDLKQHKREVTRPNVVSYLHLQDRDKKDCTDAEIKQAEDKVDYDLKRIKLQLLKDFTPGTPEYKSLYATFSLEHLTDVFKTYAYFGLYPDSQKRYVSYLSGKLDKWIG